MSTSLNVEQKPESLAVRPEQLIDVLENRLRSNATLRDVTAVLFRQSRLLMTCFVVLLFLAVIVIRGSDPDVQSRDEDSGAARTDGPRRHFAVELAATNASGGYYRDRIEL